MVKPTRSSVQFLQAVREDEEERQRLFLSEMKDFPCSFNLGCSNLDIGNIQYRGFSISEPALSKQCCKYLRQNLENAEREDYEDIIWRENLLTRIHVELDDLSTALALNENILKVSGDQNLVVLGNAAFLYHQNNDIGKVNNILACLNKLKKNKNYKDLKIQALLEQAYEYRKFGGARHNLCSIALFDFALPLRPQDERLQFMRAMVYRRCTHFEVYLEDPEHVDRHRCALDAANELYRLGNEAREEVIRSTALIELAYLKRGDDVLAQSSMFKNDTPLLDRRTWSNIVGCDDWKTLCSKALKAAGKNLTERVLQVAGQLYRNFRNNEDLQMSETLLKNAISIKPTSRAHHQLGLTYRAMAINFERKSVQRGKREQRSSSENNNVITNNHLPQPPEHTRPQNLDERLKYMLKVPRERLLPFSEGNPNAPKAVEHFKQAVIISYEHNIPAFYDLGTMYVQMSKFDDAKKTIQSLIHAISCQFSEIRNPIYHVKAYNLFGICYAMEADKTEDDTAKIALVHESEKMLIKAVRMASNLAADIPELATAATDLWKAFDTLKKKFEFEGSVDSKNILFELCEFIVDYRCIETIDKIISKDPSEWKNVKTLDRCLKCYLNLEDIDGALLFLDMILIHPEASHRFKRQNNPNVQKLMFEVAKRTLSRFLLQTRGGHALTVPDQIWKRMFQETFDASNNSQRYDIVIVQDLNGDNEPEPGTRSGNVSKYLKDILMKVYGLNVVMHHEVGLPGAPHLAQYMDTIKKSHVVIFVLSSLSRESQSLELRLENTLLLNEEANESVVLGANSELERLTLPQEPRSVSNLDPAGRETVVHEVQADNFDIEEPISDLFRLIISSCTKMCVERKKPAHIFSVYHGEMEPAHLPDILMGFPKIYLSDTDINTLSSALHNNVSDKTVDLLMTIIKAVIKENIS